MRKLACPLRTSTVARVRQHIRRASRLLLDRAKHAITPSYDSYGAYKDDPQAHTDTDREVEDLLRRGLEKDTPFPVIGEESGGQELKKGFHWLVDPIDGTTHFVRRIPLYATSVALVRDGAFPVYGIVNAPAFGLCYEAVIGRGSTCNNRRIRVPDSAADRRPCVGVSAHRSFRRVGLEAVYSRLLKAPLDIRQFGAPALECCFVSDGRLDARIVAGFRTWDIAAAVLIVSEAGGAVFQLDGTSVSLATSNCVVVTSTCFAPSILRLCCSRGHTSERR